MKYHIYRSNYEKILDASDRDAALANEIRKWRVQGIRNVFLYKASHPLADKFLEIIQKEGFHGRMIADDTQLLQRGVEGNVALLYGRDSHDELNGLLSPYTKPSQIPQMPTVLQTLATPEVKEPTDTIPDYPEPDEGIPQVETQKEKTPAKDQEEVSRKVPDTVSEKAPSNAAPESASDTTAATITKDPKESGVNGHAGITSPTQTDESSASKDAKTSAAKIPEKSTDSEDTKTTTEVVIPKKDSPFTIKVKLIGIISSILLAALSAIILLATYFFKQDNEARIQESSLELTGVIGSKIEAELLSISYRGELIAAALSQSKRAQGLDKPIESYFQGNTDSVLYVGVAERVGTGAKVIASVLNEKYLETAGISVDSLDRARDTNMAALLPAFDGATIIQNASPGSGSPLLAIALPPTGDTNGNMIVMLVDPIGFLKTFQSSEIRQVFMVESKGDIIAHPDSKLVLVSKNVSDIPIVKYMLESTNDNGLRRYEYEGKFYLGSFKKLAVSGLGIISTVDEDKAYAAIYRIQKRNMAITGIILILSVIVVYIFSKTLSEPVKDLVWATKKVESGDYNVDIKPTSRDEVGVLTTSFVQMAKGLQERERIKDAFGRFVNKEIAEKAQRGEIALGGERKDCAIFFSDLRGFTAMSEGMEPEEVVAFLNEYFTEMVSCVQNNHGIVDKFIGDAIMATWGAVSSHGNNTENAVNAALDMRKALLAMNERNKGTNKPQAKMGSGINMGPVISGQIGSEQKLEYTVIGDAVNLASRIESLNKPFGTDVLISTDAYESVKDIFVVEKMPAIKVKGKTDAQVIYAVVRRKDDTTGPNSIDEVRKLLGIDHKGEKGDVHEEEKEVKYEILEK